MPLINPLMFSWQGFQRSIPEAMKKLEIDREKVLVFSDFPS
ncbi:MAG: hypothetical protein ACTS73_06825 [Arsenophonus sp. NEOnobi-MAG3]